MIYGGYFAQPTRRYENGWKDKWHGKDLSALEGGWKNGAGRRAGLASE
jgi:hypothetical protein